MPAVAQHGDEAAAGEPRPAADVVPASRCGECHEKMYEEWKDSTHRSAGRSPLFRAMRADAASDACDGCHAPLGPLIAPQSPAADDGVSCEVCHRIEFAEVLETGPAFVLRREHDTKFGPLCDAKQPYFHRSECSPLFESATLCGSCHTWVRETLSGERVPVYTEYLDWAAGPARRKPCQSCHMPRDRASVATSEPERDGVPHHGFLGVQGTLRGSGVTVRAIVTGSGTTIRVSARVSNVRAGHFVPAGMSGRQLVLRARVISKEDSDVDRAEVVFERRLVDARGEEAPFYRAVRVGSDTRLAPRQSRTVTLELEATGAGRLELELVGRNLSPILARRLGQVAQEVLHRGSVVALNAPGGAARTGLPREVKLTP
jgi:hypothetical protein